jgi:glutathione S-transferase
VALLPTPEARHAKDAPTGGAVVKLYSGPLSLFTAKVRVALDEKGLAYEKISVPWSLEHRYEPHHPDVVALNPKAQVPVLVDGEVAVYDSTLIFEYLEERYPNPPLYPRDVAERVRCRRLEAAADEILFPPIWNLIDGGFYPAAGGGRDEERLAAARTALEAQYTLLEKELTGRVWLCDRFSVADIATFVMVRAASGLGAAPSVAHAALREWLARTLARPAAQREMDEINRFLANLPAPRFAREDQKTA